MQADTFNISLTLSVIDIDQLTKILQLVGTPDQEYLSKISSDTVSHIPTACTCCTRMDLISRIAVCKFSLNKFRGSICPTGKYGRARGHLKFSLNNFRGSHFISEN